MSKTLNERIERLSNMLGYIMDDTVELINDTEAELNKIAKEKGKDSEEFKVLEKDWNFMRSALNKTVNAYEFIGNASCFRKE